MPRHKKPPEWRQRTNTPDVGELEPPDDLDMDLIDSTAVPKPPIGLLKATRVSWDRYFRSVARQATIVSLDLDLLERLWILYDERARAQIALRRPIRDEAGKIVRSDSRVVEGSQGQMRPNGLYQVIARLDAEIRQLEDRSGKSMKARLSLGMTAREAGDDGPSEPGEPRHAAGDDVEDDGGPAPDPRLYVMDGGAR